MSTIEQERRRIAIDTPLGKDVLLLQSFSGHEEMSRLFSYELELRSTKDSIKAQDIVGKRVTFRVEMPDGGSRYFNGFVRRFAYCGKGDRLSIYRAEIVPWLWFLTKTSDCRIFQDKKIPEIVEQIFKDLGFSDFEINCKGEHPKWEYCVQYRETDFNFVSRLMEEEGIFYFFKHEQGKHTLVVADDKGAYQTAKESNVNFEYNLSDVHNLDEINSWVHQWEFRTGKWAHTDYNFETPSSNLMANDNSRISLDGMSKFEHYDYPGEYEQKGEGDHDVKLRMQEEEASHDIVHGASSCRSFSPGYKFQLGKHHTSSEAGKYVITSIRHSASVGGSYISGSSDTSYYENSFTCIPDSVTFRPARITPKPMIHGVQTAVVVGPKGEEIYTDKYGRIKVQFHWDREGKKDEKSSCWMRCQQIIAGKKWGAMFIPRIGQEVVVTHVEGDPDRPLVTGVLYNAEQMPPYTLPDEKTKSCIKTNSSKGGDGHNEIRFEDLAGKEQLYLHAERNMDVRVKHDYMESILGDQHITIGNEKDKDKAGDQKTLIWRDQHVHVKRERTEQIDGNVDLEVGYGDAADGGRMGVYIEKDKYEDIGKNSHLTIGENQNIKVGQTHSFQAGMDLQEKVGMNWAIESGMNIHIKAGMCMVLEAGLQLSLKVGGNFVDINPTGVAINGIMVLINSGGAAGSGSGAKPTEPELPGDKAPADPTPADDSKTGQKSCP